MNSHISIIWLSVVRLLIMSIATDYENVFKTCCYYSGKKKCQGEPWAVDHRDLGSGYSFANY